MDKRPMITEEQILESTPLVEAIQKSEKDQTPIKLEEVDQWLDKLKNSDD